MRAVGSRPSGSIPGLSAILLAVAALGVTPLPLTADIASVSGNAYFSFADSGDIQYTVNPDGSVQVTGGDPFSGSWFFYAGQCAPRLCDLGVFSPSLPDGSIINSATFSFDVSVNPYLNVGNGAAATVDGSAVLTAFTVTDITSPGCSFTGSAGPLLGVEYTFSFLPCTTAGDLYVPNFFGTDTFTLTPTRPPSWFPGSSYYAGYNAFASADYTVTEDYTPPVPEPGTYGVVVGLIMVGLVGIRFRTWPTRRSHPR